MFVATTRKLGNIAASNSKLFLSPSTAVSVRNVHIEARLEELGITLPPPPTPKGSYRNFVRMGNVGFLAGHLPQPAEGPLLVGKVGDTVTDEEAKAGARVVGKNK